MASGRDPAFGAVLLMALAVTCQGCSCSETSLQGVPDDRCDLDAPAECDVVLPFGEEPCPETATMAFSTELQIADVLFTVDVSSSMIDEIFTLRAELRDVIVPEVLETIPDVWFGVGTIDGCTGGCMQMPLQMTGDVGRVQAALDGIDAVGTGDEPYTHNLYAIATGDMEVFPGGTWGGIEPREWTCTPPGAIGWPCFRTGAIPIVVQISDEDFDDSISHCRPPEMRHEDAIDALNAISAKYIGVNSQPGLYGSRADMEIIASGTGSVDERWEPLIFDVDPHGADLGDQLVEAIRLFATAVPLHVSAVVRDGEGDEVDALSFVERVEPTEGRPSDPGDSRECTGGLQVEDEDGDGHPDAFVSILGPTMCFGLVARPNETIVPGTGWKTFPAHVDVLADGVTVLDTREVVFCVPPG
jgi:hypothetical protein